MIVLAVVAAQLADLATWPSAILRHPSGELFPLAMAGPNGAIVAKALGIAVLVIGIGALRSYPRIRGGLAALFVILGLLGATTNIVFGQ